jgi:hypothetical protein
MLPVPLFSSETASAISASVGLSREAATRILDGISTFDPLEGNPTSGATVVVESALFVIGSAVPEEFARESSTGNAVTTCTGSFVIRGRRSFARVRFPRVAAA